MKKFLLLIATLSFTALHAQVLFEREISNTLKLGVGDVHRMNDGSMLLSCYSYPTSVDSVMALLVKTDSLMNIQWTKRFKALHSDGFSCITPLSDGNILVGGSIRESFNPLSGGSIYKMDTAGNVAWHKVYSNSYDDKILKIFERPDNSLMIFIRKGVSGHPTKIIHANSTGAILSQRIYSSGGQGIFAEGVTSDANDNYYMAGTIYNSVSGLYSLFVCATDESSLLWFKRYDFTRSIESYGIAYTSDGNLACTGSIPDTTFPNTYNSWMLKMDLSGNWLWANEYGQPQAFTETLSGIKALSNGSILALGQANTFAGSEALAFSVDASGNVQWAKTYNHFAYQNIYSAYPQSDGRILFNGWSLNSGYLLMTDSSGTSACNSSPRTFVSAAMLVTDSALVLTTPAIAINSATPPYTVTSPAVNSSLVCSGSVGINETEQLHFDIFPVPGNKELNIQSPVLMDEIKIMNAVGKGVYGSPVNSFRTKVELNNFADGIYFVKIQIGSTTEVRKIIIHH